MWKWGPSKRAAEDTEKKVVKKTEATETTEESATSDEKLEKPKVKSFVKKYEQQRKRFLD
ncbi:6167_t:CDS:2 [Paraglomus brasilianum]|uniref:6167_t:CDS:1 n=1 Tax=Paraglomus brasilianum TaxID=144538 RepID=A0A9N9DAE2_9GLOM|nr:6167_t:CDS:2 [Paraglomus brasilianum]